MPGESVKVAVVTADSSPATNALWYAAADLGCRVRVIGAPVAQECALPPIHTTLAAYDLGRGLIYRHLRGLRRELDAFSPDLVHYNGELWSVTSQELLARRRPPLVVHGAENIWDHGHPMERWLRHRLVRHASTRIRGYASWNEAGAEYVRRLTGGTVPVLTLPAVIPPPSFRRKGISGVASDEKRRIILVGSLIPLKGFATAIDAVGLLGDPRYQVVVCGSGPEQEALRDRAAAAGVDILFAGHLSADELANELSKAYLLIQPSISTPDCVEQFGRTVAEAMTVGVPCLVSDSGELPRVVRDQSCVFPEGDALALSRLIARAAAEPQWLDLVRAAQAARATDWSPNRAGAAVVDFWLRCLCARMRAG